MSDKLEAIRKACIAANPDIAPQVFTPTDSEFVGFKGNMVGVLSGLEFFPAELCKTKRAIYHVKSRLRANAERVIEIHEYRPIRLADVLSAIGEKQLFSQYRFSINASGRMHQTTIEEDGREQYVAGWNLLRDDLTEQTAEGIDFLYELLK
jgi:hypothetical protein